MMKDNFDTNLRWWIMVSLAGIVIISGGAWAKWITEQMTHRSELISQMTIKIGSNTYAILKLEEQLRRIEDKLDALLMKKGLMVTDHYATGGKP